MSSTGGNGVSSDSKQQQQQKRRHQNVGGSTTTTSTTPATTPYMENPTKVLPVRVDVGNSHDDDDEQQQQITRVAVTLCPALLQRPRRPPHSQSGEVDGDENHLSELSIRPLHGGLSNELFVVERKRDRRRRRKATTVTAGNDNESDDARLAHHSSDDSDVDSDDSDGNDNDSDHPLAVLVRIHPSAETEDEFLAVVDDDENDDPINRQPRHKSSSIDSNDVMTLVNRSFENRLVAWLSHTGDAPRYYGRFLNGRVEQYYHGHVPLAFKEMPQYSAVIAQLLANLHNKTSDLYAALLDENDVNNNNVNTDRIELNKGGGDIWRRGHQWLTMSKQLQHQQHQQQKHAGVGDNMLTSSIRLVEQLEAEWVWLESVLRSRPSTNRRCDDGAQGDHGTIVEDAVIAFCGEIVLTHMDCQSLNLLRPQQQQQHDCDNNNARTNESQQPVLRLIDYEYAGFNPRAVDLANTFCEYCDMNNLCADYEHEYPAPAVQDRFLTSYLINTRDAMSGPASVRSTSALSILKNHADDPEMLQLLRAEVNRYTLVSHLQWAIWSCVQHHMRCCRSGGGSPPPAAAGDLNDSSNASATSDAFDYQKYARHRMVGYELHKQKYWGCKA